MAWVKFVTGRLEGALVQVADGDLIGGGPGSRVRIPGVADDVYLARIRSDGIDYWLEALVAGAILVDGLEGEVATLRDGAVLVAEKGEVRLEFLRAPGGNRAQEPTIPRAPFQVPPTELAADRRATPGPSAGPSGGPSAGPSAEPSAIPPTRVEAGPRAEASTASIPPTQVESTRPAGAPGSTALTRLLGQETQVEPARPAPPVLPIPSSPAWWKPVLIGATTAAVVSTCLTLFLARMLMTPPVGPSHATDVSTLVGEGHDAPSGAGHPALSDPSHDASSEPRPEEFRPQSAPTESVPTQSVPTQSAPTQSAPTQSAPVHPSEPSPRAHPRKERTPVTRPPSADLPLTAAIPPPVQVQVGAVQAQVEIVSDGSQTQFSIDGHSRHNLPFRGTLPAGYQTFRIFSSDHPTLQFRWEIPESGLRMRINLNRRELAVNGERRPLEK